MIHLCMHRQPHSTDSLCLVLNLIYLQLTLDIRLSSLVADLGVQEVSRQLSIIQHLVAAPITTHDKSLCMIPGKTISLLQCLQCGATWGEEKTI